MRWRTRAAVVALGVASFAGYAAGARWLSGSDWTFQGYVGLFAGLFVLYLGAAWVVLRHASADRSLIGLILLFGLSFRIVLLPTPVVLSSDVFRYLWDGQVQGAGISPYRYPPAAPELEALRDATIFPRINRPASRTIYPPGTEMVFALVAGIAPGSLLAWRLFLLGAEIVTGVLLLDLLRRMGVSRSGVLLYAWAPLVVFEGVQSGHLEGLVVLTTLLALRWRQMGRMAAAGAALGGAVLLKLYPAVLLLVWWRRGDRRLPLACAGVVAAGYLLYLVGGGPDVLGFLPGYFGSAEDFNIGLRFFLTGWLPLVDGIVREAVRGLTMLALGGALLVVLWRLAAARPEDAAGVFRVTMAAAAAYLVLVPTAMHAWYAVWMVPFLTVHPSPAWLWFTGAIALSYLTYPWEGHLPLWLRLVEFGPLYGLLWWEWRTGRTGRVSAVWRPLGREMAPGLGGRS